MSRKRKISLCLMVLLYIAAGINHFVNEPMYLRIMPPWLPAHTLLVQVSGVCEILFGLLLIPEKTRRSAAWLIIALLVAVFPANIQMAVNYYHEHNPWLWIAIVRLPVQLLLINWAWMFAKKRKHRPAA